MQSLKNYKRFKTLALFFGLGVLCAFLGVALGEAPQVKKVENIFYDFRSKQFTKHSNTNPQIKQILIDQKSLEWMSTQNGLGWPWPREIYSYIVSYLKEGGAKVVVFDMIFTEPSVYGAHDDAKFAEALKGVKSIGAVVVKPDGGKSITSIPEIDGAFFAKGNVNAEIDEDGVVRRAKLSKSGTPALSVATFDAFFDKNISVNDDLRVINYRGRSFSFASYNAAEILSSKLALDGKETPKINPSVFKGAVVFVGLSAEGLHDLRATPTEKNFVGTEIHSTILDNIIKNDFIVIANPAILLLWSTLFAVAASLFIYKIERLYALALLYVALPLSAFFVSVAYHKQGVWLSSTVILSATLLSVIFASILKYAIEGRQKSYIKSAFGKYISPLVVEELIKNPDMLKLGGEERRLSIFFSDIAGFTTISEKLPPQTLITMLNKYLNELSKIILSFGGTIDKYEGDAIIAFWNAPVTQDDHASLALKAALGCQNKVKELNTEFAASLGISLNTRIGINTGNVIVGNIGSSLRFDYSFIGDAGNFASRLEGTNKFFATKILVSEDTANMLDASFNLREVGKIKVVGKTKAVRVFEPCDYLNESQKRAFGEGLEAFYTQDFYSAETIFGMISDIDPVARRYVDIIKEVQDGEIVWDGALVMTSK